VNSFLNIAIVVSSALIIVVVLLQNQGSGLGDAFGGSSNSYRSRRGAERGLFSLTIFLAVVLSASLIARLVLA
jgi:protein translocase SecG subunit